MTAMLTEIDTAEVSLVTRGANKKRFALRKEQRMQKAEWTAAYVNDLPDSAFLYIEPGGEKGDDGRTTPRTLRHFPVRDADGKIDLDHLRNAISRIPQADLDTAKKRTLQERAQAMLEEANKAVAPEEPEADPEDDTDPEVEVEVEVKPEAEPADEVKKPLDGLSDSAREAVMHAIEVLASVAEELPAEVLDGVARALGYSGADDLPMNAGPDGQGENTLPPNPEEPMTAKTEPVAKTEPAQLSPEAKAQIEKAEKSAAEATAQLAELKKANEAEASKRVELEKQIAKERDERLTKEFIAKAAKLEHVPSKPDELGPILKELSDKAPEAAAKLEKVLEASNTKLATVLALTKEQGHSLPGAAAGADSAWGKILKSADEIRKADVKLSKEQAIQKACELNPELYEQYNRESQARS